MIYARRKHPIEPLALQTRFAALRFVFRRKVSRLVNLPWSRVTLHWRRRRNEPRSARASGGGRLNVWTPQFHLYFPARAVELLHETRVLKSVESALLRHTQRIVLNHRTVRVREVASRLQAQRESLPRPDVDRKGDSTVRSRLHSRMPSAVFWPATTAWLISRNRRPSLERTQKFFVVRGQDCGHVTKRVTHEHAPARVTNLAFP
jgi:hypothetical protein